MSKSARGFSLAELILAAAILAFALSGLLLLFSNCVLLNETNRNLTMATSHAKYVLEEIRHLSVADIGAQLNLGKWNWNTAAITAQGLSPLRNEAIATQSSGVNPLTLTVTVTWNDRHNRAHSTQMQTIVPDY